MCSVLFWLYLWTLWLYCTLPYVLVKPPCFPYCFPHNGGPSVCSVPFVPYSWPHMCARYSSLSLHSIFYHINPCSRSTRLLIFLQYFTILTCSQAQQFHRMVEESSTTSSDDNKNKPTTRNNAMAAALNNLAQALSNLQTRYQNTWDNLSHAPTLDPFMSTQYFNLSSRSRSNTFKISYV